MKVCAVSYSIYEQDNRVMRYAETLAARGDEVDVIALRRPGEPREVVIKGVKVFRVQRRGHTERTRVAYLLRIVLFFFRAMWFLMRRQMSKRYDVIHVHSVPDFLVFTAWLPRLMGSRIILDIHDLLPEFYASKFRVDQRSLPFKLMLVLERWSTSFAHHVIVANHIWRERLVARCVPVGKCTALLNYPDRTVFRQRGRTRTDGKFVMLYPGTLNWHQGVDIAIRAFALIAPQVPEAEFHIYGIGAGRASLMALAEELQLQSRVLFKGSKPLREIVPIMENCDLVVVPKRKNGFGNEAFSTKILESMALGVPVVVSDTDVDRYYFNDSVVRFFHGEDEKDLAAAMLLLIRNSELRQRIVRNALEFVGRYDWEVNKWIYLELINKVLSLSQPAEPAPVPDVGPKA